MRVRHLAELDADAYTRLMQRSTADVQRVMPQVQAIMDDVRQSGDAPLRDYTAPFATLAAPDCHARPQPGAEDRLIAVAPEVRFTPLPLAPSP